MYKRQELGLLDVPFLAAHCVWISPQDMELMVRHGSYVLSCPRSNLKLASGIAPLTAMLEKGVNVSLGTDGVASNNKLSMMEEMTYAALLQKGTTYNPQAIPAAQAIDMATRQGAKAMGFESGVIEAGKNADIIMLNTDGIRYTPDYDIVSNVAVSYTHLRIRGLRRARAARGTPFCPGGKSRPQVRRKPWFFLHRQGSG